MEPVNPPQPAPPPAPPANPTPPTTSFKKKGKLGMIISILIILFLLCIAGAAGYTIYKNLTTNKKPEQTACTLEAKICPDGSSVGRSGPNCEFAPCPTLTP